MKNGKKMNNLLAADTKITLPLRCSWEVRPKRPVTHSMGRPRGTDSFSWALAQKTVEPAQN